MVTSILYWFITGVDNLDYSLYPNKEFQLKYLHMYLEEAAILKGLYNNSDVIMTSCVSCCNHLVFTDHYQ